MEINQSTTTATEPITRSGSSSEAISFDDLEAITDPKAPMNADSKPESKAAKPKQKTESNDSADEKLKKKSEKPDLELVDDVAQKSGKQKPDEKLDADVPKAKMVKFKNGDADMDVPSTAKITVPINGKNEEFSVQDLVNEFSGKTNWGRKFQELDTERKTFHSERDSINSNINEIYDLTVVQGKPLDGMAMLAEILGADGDKIVKDARIKIMAELEQLQQLTPEERRERDLHEDNAVLQAKLQRRDATDAKRTESATLAKRIDDVKTKHKIDDGRFAEIFDVLKKTGSIKPEDLSPELVGQVHDNWTRMDAVDEIVFDLSLDGDALKKANRSLIEEWNKDPSLSKEEIRSIAQSVFGSKKPASKLAEKMKRSGLDGQNSTAGKAKQDQSENFFDDIE